MPGFQRQTPGSSLPYLADRVVRQYELPICWPRALIRLIRVRYILCTRDRNDTNRTQKQYASKVRERAVKQINYYYYYYAAFNAPCVGHKADESQARLMLMYALTRLMHLTPRQL